MASRLGTAKVLIHSASRYCSQLWCTFGATFWVTTPSRYSSAGLASGSLRNASSVSLCFVIAILVSRACAPHLTRQCTPSKRVGHSGGDAADPALAQALDPYWPAWQNPPCAP